jgi:hypothetical protein
MKPARPARVAEMVGKNVLGWQPQAYQPVF